MALRSHFCLECLNSRLLSGIYALGSKPPARRPCRARRSPELRAAARARRRDLFAAGDSRRPPKKGAARPLAARSARRGVGERGRPMLRAAPGRSACSRAAPSARGAGLQSATHAGAALEAGAPSMVPSRSDFPAGASTGAHGALGFLRHARSRGFDRLRCARSRGTRRARPPARLSAAGTAEDEWSCAAALMGRGLQNEQ